MLSSCPFSQEACSGQGKPGASLWVAKMAMVPGLCSISLMIRARSCQQVTQPCLYLGESDHSMSGL